MMNIWESFGASVIGPAHIANGKPNQDAWSSFHHIWGDGIVVSDGLGSKSLSNFGSNAACRSVEQAAWHFRQNNGSSDINSNERHKALLEDILNEWLRGIAPLSPKECSATCLFAFRIGDGLVRIRMLGDGCAAAVIVDGSVSVLFDDKTGGFSNLTAALSPNVEEKNWQALDVPESDCKAVLLCTDGVADDLENIEGFASGFVDTYCTLSAITASRYAFKMLADWPVPKHSDDKTIACLLQKEIADAD